MAKITFTKSGLSDLTIEQGRSFPVSRPHEIKQKRYLTEGGNAKVINYGVVKKFFRVVLSGLTQDNYDGTVNGLKTWFNSSTVNWSENNFTMTDELGETHTVRYWQDNFDMPVADGDTYQTDFLLLVE